MALTTEVHRALRKAAITLAAKEAMYRLGLCSCVAVFALVVPAQGAAVSLIGDLGSQTWNGSTLAGINTVITTPFSRTVSGRGTISGDAISTNTGGTAFDLVVTNLTFTASNAPSGVTAISLSILQYFTPLTAGGTYTATHGASGLWSTHGGNAIGCNSNHDFGGSDVHLPPLGMSNSLMLPAFSLGPATASVVNQIPVYSIISDLQLFVEDNGTLSLPGSYETGALLVPEPLSLHLMGLGAWLALTRRRTGRA